MRLFHKRWLFLGAAIGALSMQAAPALAQRANENAVATAEDAFGSSVGNERVGIYSPFNARGFSPVQAGNVRIEGMFFDYQADLNERLIAGSTVRVGLTAQGYPFPAPTGVGDFDLRTPGSEAVASTVIGYGPFGGVRAEIDAQLPITSTLGVAGGIGVNGEELYYGGRRRLLTAAVIPRWRPSQNFELIPFWSFTESTGAEAQPIIFTAGDFLPPQIERRRYFGPAWAENEVRQQNYGLLSTYSSGDWTLRTGLFRSLNESIRNFAVLSLNTTADGVADRLVLAERDRRFGSVSGEARLSRRFTESDRLHLIHLAVRGREQRRRYGGGQQVPIGRGRVDEQPTIPEPTLTFGPQSFDTVRQLTVGLGYEGRWRNVGELSLGVQRSFYRKTVDLPAGDPPPSEDSPWLFNGALSIYATPRLAFYAGYTRGLEESPVAPEVARNRDEAPPAIVTTQMDAGLRFTITRNLRLVAGLFDVRKPYYALDPTRLFTNLGQVQHRGVELSLAGQIIPRVNVVIGTVLLDARVTGAAADQGLVGPRPVGTFGRHIIGALNYSVPWVPSLSLDLAYESTSDRIANLSNSLLIPARYVWSLGGRYRFNVIGRPATLRAQLATVNNSYGFNSFGQGFYYNMPRRFSMSLITDL